MSLCLSFELPILPSVASTPLEHLPPSSGPLTPSFPAPEHSPARPHYDWRAAGLPITNTTIICANGSAGVCRKSASTPNSPAPIWTGRWPREAARSVTIAAFRPAAALRRCRSRISCRTASHGSSIVTTLIGLSRTSNRRPTRTRRFERLRPLYLSAFTDPRVVGLAIGTRPDCVPDDVLDLLSEFAERTYLSVEYGLQTIHNRSLDWMNRGHHYDSFLDAMERSRGRGFEICVHLILGLPGNRARTLATAREMARLGVEAVKAAQSLCRAQYRTGGSIRGRHRHDARAR